MRREGVVLGLRTSPLSTSLRIVKMTYDFPYLV